MMGKKTEEKPRDVPAEPEPAPAEKKIKMIPLTRELTILHYKGDKKVRFTGPFELDQEDRVLADHLIAHGQAKEV